MTSCALHSCALLVTLRAKTLTEGTEEGSTRRARPVIPAHLAKKASLTRANAPVSISDLANDFSAQRVAAGTVPARCRHHQKKRTPTHYRFPTTVATVRYSCYGRTYVH